MSHFTVAVFSDGNNTVEELLAPYQENNMGDCPEEYMEFNDVTDEYLDRYQNEEVDMVRKSNGDLIFSWEASESEKKEIIKIKFSDKYSTFDEFVQDYGGYKKDEKTG